MQNALFLRFKEHRDDFEKNFNISKVEAQKDPIHDLRVSVKKMRAISLVLKKAEVKKKILKKTIKPLKPVFKKAGDIREPQVFYGLSKEIPDHSQGILSYLNSLEKKAIENFTGQTKQFNLPKWMKNATKVLSSIESLSDETIIESAQSIIEKKNRKIDKLIRSDKKKYHKIRKQFKVNQEVLLILREIKKHPAIAEERDIAKDMGSLLGDWHDLKELGDLSRSYLKNNSSNGNVKFVENIQIRQAKLENQIDDILENEKILEVI